MKFLNSYNFAILALASTTNINISTAQQTTTSQTNQRQRTQINSHNINKQNLDNIQPRQMNRPQKRPTPAAMEHTLAVLTCMLWVATVK
jgi:hypothetical protein